MSAEAGTTRDVKLRDVVEADVPIFFEQQLDPEANRMAAFTAKDPADRAAFMAKWSRILRDESGSVKTVLYGGDVAGRVMLWRDDELDAPEVSYWIARRYWGNGIATAALTAFLAELNHRPLYGRAAADNVGSIRVLEKCGFVPVARGGGFSNARGEDVVELVFRLDADEPQARGMTSERPAAGRAQHC